MAPLRLTLVLAVAVLSSCTAPAKAPVPDGTESRPTSVEEPDEEPAGPEPCATEPASSWIVEDVVTSDHSYGRIGDLVVGRGGTATVIWNDFSAAKARATDYSPARRNTQTLPDPVGRSAPAGGRLHAILPLARHLATDAAGTQTAMWQQDVQMATGQTTESYDLVISDRPRHGSWSTSPTVLATGFVGHAQLAVNASGAAVAVWDRFEDRLSRVYASFRTRAGAPWSSARAVPGAGWLRDVGIDDRSRVTILYSRPDDSAMAVRHTRAGWSPAHRVSGFSSLAMAVGPSGAVVVAFERGEERPRPYTVRMSPQGVWGDVVRQPGAETYPERTIDVDGSGRALHTWWKDRVMMTRWSGPAGEWREACALAGDVTRPRYYDDAETHVAVNRRGDAVVVWRAGMGDGPHLRARVRAARGDWSEPIEVTATTDRPPRWFRAGIGENGDAVVVWMARNERQTSVLRISPST